MWSRSKQFAGLAGIFGVLFFTACAAPVSQNREQIYQVSTIGALMKGVYDGDTAMAKLHEFGDTGLGTLENLDGELIILDGKFYQAKLDGTVYRVPDSAMTPFAVITYFDSDQVYSLETSLNLQQLQSYIDGRLATYNVFYAIKISGDFKYMKTRSVPAQTRPFPALSEAVKNQQVREFDNIKGTVVAFRCPAYTEGINVPGYHFHFLNADRTLGGHVLDLQTDNVTVAVDGTPSFMMVLPSNADFNKIDLGQGEPEGLKQVEQGK